MSFASVGHSCQEEVISCAGEYVEFSVSENICPRVCEPIFDIPVMSRALKCHYLRNDACNSPADSPLLAGDVRPSV
jgi:hypothetical protein